MIRVLGHSRAPVGEWFSKYNCSSSIQLYVREAMYKTWLFEKQTLFLMKKVKIGFPVNIQTEWKSNFLCRRQIQGILIPAQDVFAACGLPARSDIA